MRVTRARIDSKLGYDSETGRRTMPKTTYSCSSRSSARSDPSWPLTPVISARRSLIPENLQ